MDIIKIGNVLRLHDAGLYQITDFCFKLQPESTNYQAFVTMAEISNEKLPKREYAVWMVEDMLQTGNMYPPQNEKFMTELWEIRHKRG